MITGYYFCKKEWAINGEEKAIRVSELLGDVDLRVVAFEDIAGIGKKMLNQERVKKADVRFPGILVEGGDNPLGKPFRMCDGRHRVSKLTEQGHTEAVFLIISNEYFMSKFNQALSL